jgi:hypothetical protein
MPRPDSCEAQIVSALLKAGWQVTKRNFALQSGKPGRYVYADLRLADTATGQQIIVVEVKCFPKNTLFDEFYRAYGQYQTYRKALLKNGLSVPLYMAIPVHLYTELISDTLVLEMIEEISLKRIIVDIKTEEIVQWID